MSRANLAAVAAAALAVTAPLPTFAQERAQPAAVVNMTFGLKFEPAEVRIRVGDTVEWRNRAFLVHTVSFDPAQASDPSRVSLPEGVAPFDSGKIGGGKSWRHTFTTPGTYRYVCRPHEDEGMVGVVIVSP